MVLVSSDRYSHRWWWLHEGHVHVWYPGMRMWLSPLVFTPLPRFERQLTEGEVRGLPAVAHPAWDHPALAKSPPTTTPPWWSFPPAEVELLGLNPNPQPAVRTWRFK